MTLPNYERVFAFRCRFGGRLVTTPDEALCADIDAACKKISPLEDESQIYKEIKALLDDNKNYNDTHRALLFLAEIVKHRADELVAKLEQG